MATRQAMKENFHCTSKYGHLRISQDICHVWMTDIEGLLTIYGHSDNLLNNNTGYQINRESLTANGRCMFPLLVIFTRHQKVEIFCFGVW